MYFRFNLKNLCFHEKDYGQKADFFGTAHGKGACDGIGGTVKRVIHNLSLQRPIGNQILTPRDMFLVAKEKVKNIRYVSCYCQNVSTFGLWYFFK